MEKDILTFSQLACFVGHPVALHNKRSGFQPFVLLKFDVVLKKLEQNLNLNI